MGQVFKKPKSDTSFVTLFCAMALHKNRLFCAITMKRFKKPEGII
jgi:coenzyme F420-reducing hydrogenase beta subunit